MFSNLTANSLIPFTFCLLKPHLLSLPGRNLFIFLGLIFSLHTFSNFLKTELAACTLRSTEMELLYSKQVDFLEKQTTRPSWEGPVLFIAGVLTGTAMLYGSSVLVKNLGD